MTNIRTKIIEGKQTILLVDGLPEGARKFHYFNDKDSPYLFYMVGTNTFREYGLPQGKWHYLNTIENLHGLFDILVDKTLMHENHGVKKYKYRAYTEGFLGFPTAIESFHSLLKANDVLMENPYNEPWRDDAYPPLWQEAEAKVFSPSTTLIFVKQ